MTFPREPTTSRVSLLDSGGQEMILRASAFLAAILTAVTLPLGIAQTREQSRIAFKSGNTPLFIRPIKHGSVLIFHKSRYYYIDPAQLPEEEALEKASAILVTHEHGDHCDP